MNPAFLMLFMVDVLYEAGVIDKAGQTKARIYLSKVPGYLRATVDDYEKWRKENNGR